MSNIFSSYQIKKVMFKNRIVMAPMVRFGFPCSDGIMGDMLIREYLEYCDQEIGLLISQSLSVSASGAEAGSLYSWAKVDMIFWHLIPKMSTR